METALAPIRSYVQVWQEKPVKAACITLLAILIIGAMSAAIAYVPELEEFRKAYSANLEISIPITLVAILILYGILGACLRPTVEAPLPAAPPPPLPAAPAADLPAIELMTFDECAQAIQAAIDENSDASLTRMESLLVRFDRIKSLDELASEINQSTQLPLVIVKIIAEYEDCSKYSRIRFAASIITREPWLYEEDIPSIDKRVLLLLGIVNQEEGIRDQRVEFKHEETDRWSYFRISNKDYNAWVQSTVRQTWSWENRYERVVILTALQHSDRLDVYEKLTLMQFFNEKDPKLKNLGDEPRAIKVQEWLPEN